MRQFFILICAMTLNVSAYATTYKCSGDLRFERIIDGRSEIKTDKRENLFELQMSQWAKDKITIVDNMGKGAKTTVDQITKGGILRVDNTQRKGQVVTTVEVDFDLHSKNAVITLAMTRGNKTLKRTLTGQCIDY